MVDSFVFTFGNQSPNICDYYFHSEILCKVDFFFNFVSWCCDGQIIIMYRLSRVILKPCLWWIWLKNSYFWPMKLCAKKKHQNHLKPPWNLVSFTKTDKLETWNHFWFHENWQISISSLKINIWNLKLARFQNENEDRLHREDALIFAKQDDIYFADF